MKEVLLIWIALGSGAVIAGGMFAFLAAIGIVPRMAQRTKTTKYIRMYEDCMLLGGVFGACTMFVELELPAVAWLMVCFALAIGTFVGVLAMALAETLNVMPVLMRRMRLTIGLPWMLMAFVCGKVLGSLLYFFVSGFYEM